MLAERGDAERFLNFACTLRLHSECLAIRPGHGMIKPFVSCPSLDRVTLVVWLRSLRCCLINRLGGLMARFIGFFNTSADTAALLPRSSIRGWSPPEALGVYENRLPHVTKWQVIAAIPCHP